jgi:hypothetical protein
MIVLKTANNTDIVNIIDAGLTVGKKVCIVGPGPNGLDHYHEIPEDFTVMALNKAVLIEEVNANWWVIAHNDKSWFNIPDKQYSGIRVYRDALVPSISEMAISLNKYNLFYFNVEEEKLKEKVVLPVKGCIRIGASVAALAIQLAYNLGAVEILLCGVDMSGNTYWDNSENEDPSVFYLHGEIWDSIKRLNPLLHYLRFELNVKISTLSKSNLDVPFYIKES